MFSHPNFFVSDVAEYAQNIGAQADGKKVLAFFPKARPAQLAGTPSVYRPGDPGPRTGEPDADHVLFRIALQVRRGQRQVPRGAPTRKAARITSLPKQNQDLPNFLRSALNQQLSTDRVPACFVLQIQRQNPQKFMPIEDTSIEWKESDAPYETVAKVRSRPRTSIHPN